MRFASRSSLLASLVLGVVCLQPQAAHAQNAYLPNNTTLNSANRVADSAIVGYANQNDLNNGTNPTSPTVSLVSGGSVGNSLIAYNNSVVNFSGGSISNALLAENSSVVNISGGSVGNFLEADGNSVVNVSGGSVSSLFAENSSVVNISGGIVGRVGSTLAAYNTGTLNLFGTGQTAVLVNANSGPFSQYSLSGTLSDGTLLVNLTLYVQNGTGAKFTLNNVAVTPEPDSVALLIGLTTTGVGFLSRRRKAIKNAA